MATVAEEDSSDEEDGEIAEPCKVQDEASLINLAYSLVVLILIGCWGGG